MWTQYAQTMRQHILPFQSLSRDSVHVDEESRHQDRDVVGVSIPQSGFRPCGPPVSPDRRAVDSLFQSLSRDSVHVDFHRAGPVRRDHRVSIPQSGFRPCGRSWGE